MLSSTTPCWLNVCTAGTGSTVSQTAGMNWVPGLIFFIICICAQNHSRDLRIQIPFLFWLQKNVLLWVVPTVTSGFMQIHPWPSRDKRKYIEKKTKKIDRMISSAEVKITTWKGCWWLPEIWDFSMVFFRKWQKRDQDILVLCTANWINSVQA